jgi:FRG domain
MDPPHPKAALEEHILRNLARYSRAYFSSSPPNDWELLVASQHHGLPTRLFTGVTPVVAAHFATLANESTDDRVVCRLDRKKRHQAFGLPELALKIENLGES